MLTQGEAGYQPRRSAQRRLHTVEQFCKEHPAFKPGGLRWWLFHREQNGLNMAVVRVGRKLLLDEAKFFEWVDAQNERAMT